MSKTMHNSSIKKFMGEKILAFLHTSKFQLTLVLLSILLSIIASYLAGFSLIMHVQVWPIILWFTSIILMVLAGVRYFKPNKRILLSCIFWFMLFTLAALYWRVIDTTHIPVSLSGDEGSAGLFAVNFLTGKVDNPFILGWYSFPTMFSFIQSGFIALLGQSIPGLRILTGLIGALTVGASYLLGKELFSHKVGLYTAICMVGFAFHVHFSRIALNNIWDGLSFCLVLTFFWAGWKRENRFYFIMSGLFAGFSLYFYETSKLLLLLVALLLLCLFISDRQKFNRCLPGFGLSFLSFFVVSFPLIRYYLYNFDQLLAHGNRSIFSGNWMQITMAREGIPAGLVVAKQALIGLGAFICVPLDFFYKPNTALIRPIAAVFFCIGLIYCFIKFKDPRSKILLLWILLFGLLGGFTENAPSAQRYVGAAPVCMLVVALGLERLETLISSRFIRNKKIIQLIILLTAIFLSLNDIYFYFLVYTPRSDFGGIGAKIETSLSENLNEIPGSKNVHYWGYPLISYGSLQVLPFLSPDVSGYDMDQFANSDKPLPIPSGPNKIFVFLNEDANLLPIQEKFPGGSLLKEQDSLGRFLFWQYSLVEFQ
ncbi:MAG: ArnT family glycosyltransferase [Anaerolineaceae bacterium]